MKEGRKKEWMNEWWLHWFFLLLLLFLLLLFLLLLFLRLLLFFLFAMNLKLSDTATDEHCWIYSETAWKFNLNPLLKQVDPPFFHNCPLKIVKLHCGTPIVDVALGKLAVSDLSLSPFGSLIKNCPISWRRPNLDPQPPANSLHVHSSDALNALEDLKDLSGTEIWWSAVNQTWLSLAGLGLSLACALLFAIDGIRWLKPTLNSMLLMWPFWDQVLLRSCADAEKVCLFFVRLHE